MQVEIYDVHVMSWSRLSSSHFIYIYYSPDLAYMLFEITLQIL